MSNAVIKYGLTFPAGTHELDVEAYCFLKKRNSEQGGLGRFRHFKNLSKKLFPKMEWSDWSTQRIQSLCEIPFQAWTGCGAAGKTFDIAHFAMLWWAVDPPHTSVVMTSTSGLMVRRRVWPMVQELFYNAERVEGSGAFFKGLPGIMVDSKTTLHSIKTDALGKQYKDDKCGIFGIGLDRGPIGQAVAQIQGVHNPRMMVVVDEATDTPEAIFDVVRNLRLGCDEFILIVVGNPTSHIDPHGLCCEPVNGWNSINIEMEEWATKGVKKWEIDVGICLHFDGTKSPNVKAGYRKFPYLINQDDVERATRAGTDTVGFWRQTRGFWAPDGVCRTIMSEPLVEQHDGQGKFIFESKRITVGALDTAFGGDRCILRFGWLGDVQGTDKMGLQLTDTVEVPVKATNKHEVDYQIAHFVIEECKRRGCLPEHFGLDATGIGRGVAAIMANEWSSTIIRVEFGGMASEKPASVDDPRPSREVYDRRVTELWYSCREMLCCGQLKGLSIEDIREFCHREYDRVSRKYRMDTKEECKKKLGFSPDLADAAAILVEVCRQLGAVPSSQGAARTEQDVLELAIKQNEIYDEPEYEEIGQNQQYQESFD